jgi:acyl-CoA synthetase (AMP-forming)/AMP-acid ligase II
MTGDVLLADQEFRAVAAEVAARTGRRLEWLLDPEQLGQPVPVSADPRSPAVILHTSGTTGIPKAVPYQQGTLAKRVRVNAALLSLGPGSVYASASGFHHIGGLGNYVVALAAGAAVAPMGRFSVEAWKALAGLGVTHGLLVPTMVEMLLDGEALPLPDLRMLQYGAAPIHPVTLRQALKAVPGISLINMFGQTEGSPIACLTPEDHRRILEEGRDDLLRSVGRAAPGVEVRIESADQSGTGEVVARADHLFVHGDDGWLRTGDLGRLDASGYLYLAGRRGDKIIRGGENIYPIEVEHILELHPEVKEAAVVGVPDKKWGETVRAFIVPINPSGPPPVADLAAHTRSHLAGFRVPSEWEFVASLPRSANGKLLRRQLLHATRNEGCPA